MSTRHLRPHVHFYYMSPEARIIGNIALFIGLLVWSINVIYKLRKPEVREAAYRTNFYTKLLLVAVGVVISFILGFSNVENINIFYRILVRTIQILTILFLIYTLTSLNSYDRVRKRGRY